MREIKCKHCGQIKQKHPRDGSIFCDRTCYMEWKRENPNKRAYKGKILISGYNYIYMPSHPHAIKNKRYIAEHRLVAERKLGRLLNSDEVAHHINGIKTDNREQNIMVLIKNTHDRLSANAKRRNTNGQFTKTN